MKRILTILVVIVLTTVSASAQDSNYREKASHFYVNTEFNMTGADYQGWASLISDPTDSPSVQAIVSIPIGHYLFQ